MDLDDADYMLEDGLPLSNCSMRHAGITRVSIKTNKKEKTLIITLKLIYPGIFIGKGGRNINRVEKFFTDFLGKQVKINLIEHTSKDIFGI